MQLARPKLFTLQGFKERFVEPFLHRRKVQVGLTPSHDLERVGGA